jgi:hypothetical protein
MKKIITALIIGFSLLSVSATSAQEVTYSPMAQDLNWRSSAWWANYGRYPCYTPYTHIYLADFGGTGKGYTNPANPCVTYIDRTLWNNAQGWPLNWWLMVHRDDLCRTWFHERGHSAGLPHADGWVMDSRGINYIPTIGQCTAFSEGR